MKILSEKPIVIRLTEKNVRNFRISDQNRDLSVSHKNRLIRSFVDLGTVIEYPVCDKFGTIIEGAHRFTAFLEMGFLKAHEIGLEFYIVCNPNASEDNIGAVNSFNKRWTLEDYYKHNGYEDLLIFKHNGINSQTVCRILDIKNSDLKDGSVNITECTNYESLMTFNSFFETVNALLTEKVGKSYSRGNRFYALIAFYVWNVENINLERIKTIMTGEGSFSNINSFNTLNECSKKFVEIYNKGLSKGKRIIFDDIEFKFEIK